MRSTFPNEEDLINVSSGIPEYMHPNVQPWLAVCEGYLSSHQCAEIVTEMMKLDGFDYGGCGGVTREPELPLHPVLDPIEQCVRDINDKHWEYILGEETAAWFQTYLVGDDYAPHIDGSPGQSRKLTGIALLTHPIEYDGGALSFNAMGGWYEITPTLGTVVVIPHWLLHRVSPILRGCRQTINMGFWGPPFV